MTKPTETVLVAMSGGVDSSVAAALLLEAGHAVVGVFMRNGVQAREGKRRGQGCCGVEDARDARRVADILQIPFYALNLKEAFEGLIQEWVQGYLEGRTPNPCIECNKRFKLGALMKLAGRLGASSVATGHYASIREQEGRLFVQRGRDREKDQSYVLFSLGQEVLRHTRLPLGDLTKEAVRAKARRLGLPTAQKPESMDICFVPGGNYRDVLQERAGARLAPGRIVDQEGNTLGQHGGTALFTIGQRRGLPGGQPQPLYVTAIDPARKLVSVGGREELLTSRFLVEQVVWSGATAGQAGSILEGEMQIRHHHRGVPARVTVLAPERVAVELKEPEAAVTPGQGAVLYRSGGILLGGFIARGGESS